MLSLWMRYGIFAQDEVDSKRIMCRATGIPIEESGWSTLWWGICTKAIKGSGWSKEKQAVATSILPKHSIQIRHLYTCLGMVDKVKDETPKQKVSREELNGRRAAMMGTSPAVQKDYYNNYTRDSQHAFALVEAWLVGLSKNVEVGKVG